MRHLCARAGEAILRADAPVRERAFATWLVPVGSLLLVYLVFVHTQIVALFGNDSVTGETSVLSNVAIEYVRTGKWHYPLHAHDIFYPGFDRFILQPPLHYLLVSRWIDAFGIGYWQVHAQSTLVGIVGLTIAAAVLSRAFGPATAALTFAMAAGLYGFYYSSQQIRPDMEFGLAFLLFLLVYGVTLFGRLRRRGLILATGLCGVAAVVALATHWNGYLVQLYLPVLVGWLWLRRRTDFFGAFISLLTGYAASFGLLFAFLGMDLLKALVIMPIKAAELKEVLHIPLSYAISFLTEWAGGQTVLAGACIAVVLTLTAAGVKSIMGNGIDRRSCLDLYVLANLILYGSYFVALLGNRAPQYGGNIYFLLLPFAARGFSLLAAIGAELLGRRRLADSISAIAAVALCVGSSQVLEHSRATPSELQDPNRVFRATRAALLMSIPKRTVTVLGGHGYFHLYDVPYVSTMRLVGEEFVKPPTRTDFGSLLTYYRDAPGRDLRTAPFPKDDRRAALRRHGDVLVTNDDGHSWQFLFYDPDVWEADFEERATIFPLKRSQLLSSIWPPQLLSVFVRRDRSWPWPRWVAESGAKDGRFIRVMGNAILAISPSNARTRTRTDTGVWLAMDEPARRETVKTHFQEVRWHGANLGQAERDALLDRLLPRIHYYLVLWANSKFNGVPINRTLGQAVDLVFASDGIPAVFLEAAFDVPNDRAH